MEDGRTLSLLASSLCSQHPGFREGHGKLSQSYYYGLVLGFLLCDATLVYELLLSMHDLSVGPLA